LIWIVGGIKLFAIEKIEDVNCPVVTRVTCAVHGEHMLGKPMEERLRDFDHDGDLDAQDLTEQLVHDILAEESLQSIIYQAGFDCYGWVLDARSYLQLDIPPPLKCRVAKPLAALGQIMLITTEACAKVHGCRMKYISEEHLRSREAFQRRFISHRPLRFFESMFSVRCLVKNTTIKPVVIRQPGMLFTVKIWLKHIVRGQFPLVLPRRFDEKLHEISVHQRIFEGGIRCLFAHDCFNHVARLVYAECMGRPYFSQSVSPQVMFNQLCQDVIKRASLEGMSQESLELLNDVAPDSLAALMCFTFSHEKVLVFPLSKNTDLQKSEACRLLCSSPRKDAVSIVNAEFKRAILVPAIKEKCVGKQISDDQLRRESVHEWALEYAHQLPVISFEMIMNIFDNMDDFVWRHRGFRLFDNTKERHKFECALRIVMEEEPITILALNDDIDFCFLEHRLYPRDRTRRLVLPKKNGLLQADSFIMRQIIHHLFDDDDDMWVRKVIKEMGRCFRENLAKVE